jgi:hypothetical protein
MHVVQPSLYYATTVKVVRRLGAGGQMGHVDDEALDDGRPYDDPEEQGRYYLNGAQSPSQGPGPRLWWQRQAYAQPTSTSRSARPLPSLRCGPRREHDQL